jgi:hypothetical protein
VRIGRVTALCSLQPLHGSPPPPPSPPTPAPSDPPVGVPSPFPGPCTPHTLATVDKSLARHEVDPKKKERKKKEEERIIADIRDSQQRLSALNARWSFLVALAMFAVFWNLNSHFSGVAVAKLPFEPFGMVTWLSHRNLPGNDLTVRTCAGAGRTRWCGVVVGACSSAARVNVGGMLRPCTRGSRDGALNAHPPDQRSDGATWACRTSVVVTVVVVVVAAMSSKLRCCCGGGC